MTDTDFRIKRVFANGMESEGLYHESSHSIALPLHLKIDHEVLDKKVIAFLPNECEDVLLLKPNSEGEFDFARSFFRR